MSTIASYADVYDRKTTNIESSNRPESAEPAGLPASNKMHHIFDERILINHKENAVGILKSSNRPECAELTSLLAKDKLQLICAEDSFIDQKENAVAMVCTQRLRSERTLIRRFIETILDQYSCRARWIWMPAHMIAKLHNSNHRHMTS